MSRPTEKRILIFHKGFTLLEVLIAIAIVGILIAAVLPQFNNIKQSQILNDTVENVISALHTAQSDSLASVNSSEYGVHFDSNKITIFQGETYTQGATGNNVINVISPAMISNVTLGGVSSSSGDLYFARLSGIPSKSGTITISLSGSSKTVTVLPTGAVSRN